MKNLKLLLTVLFLFCCSSKNNDKKVSLILSWLPGAEHAFIYRAMDKGYFNDEGLAIDDPQPSFGSKDVATALELGTANFGLISGDFLVLARKNGIPIKGLITLYHDSPATILSFDTLKTPYDLIGKKVGVLSQSTTYPQFLAMLQKKGISRDAVSEISAMQGGIAQLISGEIDALMHYTNYAPVMLRAKGYFVSEILMKDNGISIYGTTLATTDAMISNHPELIQKVVNIFLKSLIESRDDFEGALSSLINHNPKLEANIERIGLARTNELIFDEKAKTYGVGYMLEQDWASTQNTLLETRQIENAISTKYFFNDTFLRKAKENIR